jgi:hypothetical protein
MAEADPRSCCWAVGPTRSSRALAVRHARPDRRRAPQQHLQERPPTTLERGSRDPEARCRYRADTRFGTPDIVTIVSQPAWKPRTWATSAPAELRSADYVYVSCTNAVALSPTDVMSLTRRVKMMMLAEAAVSAMTTLLVAARAVNILR